MTASTAATSTPRPYDVVRRELLSELHAAMNGVAAKAITDSGMGYSLVFGVELPRLREIAATFEPSLSLALALWQESVRELRMLAIMLMPPADFDATLADLWLSTIKPQQAELCSLLTLDLLSAMPDSSVMAFALMAHDDAVHQLAGFLLMSRLFSQGATLSPDAAAEYADQARSLLHSSYMPLARAVSNSLLRYAQTSAQAQRTADKILCN